MGFYFRKSVKFGPMRFNFSKSGIGVSAGVKGARVSMGPRGTYVHAGTNGFYYRQRIGGSNVRSYNQRPSSSPQNFQPQNIPIQPASSAYTIETADVSRLVETSSVELINQINETAKQMRYAPFAVLATFALSFVAFIIFPLIAGMISVASGIPVGEPLLSILSVISFVLATAVFIAGLIFSWKIYKGDQLKRTTPLFYELEQDALNKFTAIQQACEALSRSARIWRIQTEQPTWDRRRNAGASSLLTRHPVSVNRQSPPFIATNVDVWSIKLNDYTLFFMPDYIFVLQNGKYGAVSYDTLNVSFSPTRFIEDQAVPPDAKIVDYTWQYVNKNGSPDRRFSNNRQIPIAQYGFIQFQSRTGMNIHLHASNLDTANYFANGFNRVSANSQRYKEWRSTPKNEGRTGQPKVFVDESLKSAYEILGVSVGASAEQITTAYRQMAKMYHPDRLASLAPEFMEIAEERMKDINDAYAKLKKQ
jgi:hypothetical protein